MRFNVARPAITLATLSRYVHGQRSRIHGLVNANAACPDRIEVIVVDVIGLPGAYARSLARSRAHGYAAATASSVSTVAVPSTQIRGRCSAGDRRANRERFMYCRRTRAS